MTKEKRVKMVQYEPNPNHRWWNFEPKHIRKEFFLKVNKKGYVYAVLGE
jgi:hypothetical protein